ncbi:MAG: response regulator transcription factor [Gammaproteobacteria bacterium]|nr:response regulator transcription factor [Gammaproteobacteria bacterium]
MSAKRTVLITEPHSILRAGLRALLSIEPDLEVIADVDNSYDTLRLIEQRLPELVIVDFKLPGIHGMGIVAAIRQRFPATKVLVLTQHKNEDCIREALRDGATGYVLKDTNDAELILAVRSVLAGKTYLSPSISEKVIHVFLLGNKTTTAQSRWDTLTQREREILKLIAHGHTSKYIAQHFGLSIKTIEKHRSNMMKKLQLHNISALTNFANGQGQDLLSPT